jgi:DNA topoisomerase-2
MSQSEAEYLREKYSTDATLRDHMIGKSMWAGSTEFIMHNRLVCYPPNNRICRMQIPFTFAWFKMYDELIVNAIDRCIEESTARNIHVTFDGYVFTIENDGPGFDVTQHPTRPELYIPEYLITVPFSGSQLKKSDKNISGGTNGIGLKIMCNRAEQLRLYTMDSTRQRLYIQSFSAGNALGAPEIINMALYPYGYDITELKRRVYVNKPFTLFLYKQDLNLSNMPQPIPEQLRLAYIGMMKARVMQAAAYLNSSIKAERLDYRTGETPSLRSDFRCNLWFNNEHIKIYSLRDYVHYHTLSAKSMNAIEIDDNGDIMFNNDNNDATDIERIHTFSTVLTHIKFPWDLCVTFGGTYNNKDGDNFSVIDGVVVIGESTPNYFSYWKNQIIKEVMEAYKEKINAGFSNPDVANACRGMISSFLRSTMSIYLSFALVNPQWVGQEKNAVGFSQKMLHEYAIPPGFTKQIIEKCSTIVNILMTRQETKEVKRILRRNLAKPPHDFIDAPHVRAKNRKYPCILLLSEGGSATMLLNLLVEAIGHETVAIYDLRGVPMNARKQIKNIVDMYGQKIKSGMHLTEEHITRELAENEILLNLMKVMGLQYGKRYATLEERATLRYNLMVAAVDQDLDGMGKISTLIQSFIELFWPELYNQGIVTTFITPLVMITNKRTREIVEMFNYESDMQQWMAANPSLNPMTNKSLRIEYLKGLGSNSEQLIPLLVDQFYERILRIIPNGYTHEIMDKFYCEDTEPRKVILRTPLEQNLFPKPEFHVQQVFNPRTKQMEYTQCPYVDSAKFIYYNAKAFSLDNLKRMLPGMDGLNESRRKVIATVRKLPKSTWTKGDIKTATLAGAVTKEMNYAHGEASLAKTISNMCLTFPGARVIPFLSPNGIFGTRGTRGVNDDKKKKEDKNGADPRYTHTRPLDEFVYTIYPPEDDIHLQYDEDCGEYYEPRYYVPIDCITVAEYWSNPATGWKVEIYPREHKSRIENIKRMIDAGSNKVDFVYMPPNLNGFKGQHVIDFENPGAAEYMVGTYEAYETGVRITELPINISPKSYCDTIKAAFGPPTQANPNALNILLPESDNPIRNYSVTVINIELHMALGWQKKLARIPPCKKIDYLAYNLYLVERMNNCINMIYWDNSVREYTNYDQPMRDWFLVRDELWRTRIRRILIINEGKQTELVNKIRFLSEYEQLNIKKIEKPRAIEILREHGYKAINHRILVYKNCRLSNDQFERAIYDENAASTVSDINDDDDNANEARGSANFDYLINMRYSDAFQSNITRLERELEELKQEHTLYSNPNYYKELWKQQLDKLLDYYNRRDEIIAKYLPKVPARMYKKKYGLE